jgi:excisionase family DNA binding protein
MEKKLCITVEEMGKELRIGRSMAYQLARREDFPTIRIGRKMLIATQGLEAWVEKQAGLLDGLVFAREGRAG